MSEDEEDIRMIPEVHVPKWWRPHRKQFGKGWFTWRGDDKRYYAALHGSDPYTIVSGGAVAELITEIKRIEGES